MHERSMPERVLMTEMAVILTQPCLKLSILFAVPLWLTPPVSWRDLEDLAP
jgi:hypothetical protein